MPALSLAESDPTPESLALRAKKSAARVLTLCNNLEDWRDRILPQLPNMADEVVIEVRMGARAIGVWAWIIECACDHEMFQRVERAKPGPKVEGEQEEESKGKVAAAGQQAYLDGKGVRTVYRNAQIIDTFGHEFLATNGKELQDKQFWIVAMEAPDPKEAIEALVTEKIDNPFLEPKDAWRVIDEMKGKHEKAKNEFIEVFRSVSRKVTGEWIRFKARPALEALKTDCPDTALLKVFDEVDQQLREREEVMLIEDASTALILAWERGYRTDKQMEDFTRLLPLEIRTAMLSLQDKGYFVEQDLQWKSRKGRGPRPKEWQRTSKPLPTIHVVPPNAA